MASDSGQGSGQDGSLGPRTAGRHAAPRTTVRRRLQLPVGRAIALTAVPTALLMGTIAPKFALAADVRSTSASSSSENAVSGPAGDSCTKTSLKALENGTAGTTAPSKAKSGGTDSTGQASTSPKSSPKTNSGGTAGTRPATPAPSTTPTPAPTGSTPTSPPKSPQPTSPPSSTPKPVTGQPVNPITGILNGLGGLLGLDQSQTAPQGAAAAVTPAAAPTVTATTAPAKAVQQPAQAVTQSATPSATAAPSSPATHPSTPAATPTHPAAAPTHTAAPAASAAPGTAAAANKLCDIRSLAAPLDTSVINGITEMPSVPWTLKSSDLELINTQFWGVVTVPTAAGDVRVLKFTAQEVNIGDLDMSTQQVGQELHVQGGPGTTSSMSGGTVTMYVTSLSGTLASAEGIPLAWLGVNLTLTPDTLPQWLYDLIGDVPIPLTLSLTNAVATQTGQFGGNLTIPGMHLFYTPLS